jgi:hypothetical protein
MKFGHQVDIHFAPPNVHFRGQSGHDDCSVKCPLMTQSGHAARPPITDDRVTRTATQTL